MNEQTAGPGQIGGIDHVAVAVVDADRAAATFSSLLGLRIIGDEQVEAAGVRLMYLTAVGTEPVDGPGAPATLQLVQPFRPGKVAEFLTDHGEGLHHVCFRTLNIEAALHRALVPDPIAAIFAGGRGRPCAFLAEQPHGTLLELTELALHIPEKVS